MPKTIQTKLYKYSELSDKAKEKAREWWQEHWSNDNWRHEQEWVYGDVKEIAKLLGIDIDRIYYSGFWSQGDGACFEGSYSYKKGWRKALLGHLGDIDEKTIAKFRSQNPPWDEKQIELYIRERERLISIGEDLQKIQKKYFYGINSRVKHSGHYYHEYCTNIDNYTEAGQHPFWGDLVSNLPKEDDEAMTEALRDFMRYIYARLEETYEWMCEEEYIADDLEANEATFTKSGQHAYEGDLIDDDEEDDDADDGESLESEL